MTQPIGSGMPIPITFTPEVNEIVIPTPDEIEQFLLGTPLVAGQNPDVYGNNAYFNNLFAAVTQLANLSVTNQNLGYDVARQNQMVNGGFEFWQRGLGPFTTTSSTADRWFLGVVSGDTVSMTQSSTNVAPRSKYSAAITYTPGGTGNSYIYQMFDVADGYDFDGSQVSASVAVNTTSTSVRVSIISDGTGSVTVNSPFSSGSGTWQTLRTPPFTVPANATYVQVILYFGTTAATHYFDNAVLALGTVAPDFVPLTPADELNRCLRYYQRRQIGSTDAYFMDAYAATATALYAMYRFIIPMAGPPNITYSPVGQFTVYTTGGPTTTVSSIAVSNIFTQSAQFTIGVFGGSGLAAAQASILGGSAGTFIAAESNP